MKDITELVKAAGARPGVARLETGSRVARETGITAPEGDAQRLPPTTNRGVTVQWAGLHWFAGTQKKHRPDAVLSVLEDMLNLTRRELSHGGYGYACSAAVGSARVYWSDTRPDVFTVLPGDACEALGVAGVVGVATLLDLVPNSRLDVAWDVDGITPVQVRDDFLAGQVVTRIHRQVNKETGRMQGVDFRSNHEGDTVYLGSRSSTRFLRVYDRRGPTRVEMEWKKERAELLWARLLACAEEEWSSEALSELRAFVDFRERSEGDRPETAPLLSWWAEFTDGAGRWCASIPRKAVKSVDQLRMWVRRQVSGVLALVADAVGDWNTELDDILTEGRIRYRARRDRVALLEMARVVV